MAIIKVRLKDAGQNTLHPETDWSVVENRPAITVGQNSSGQKKETWSAPITSVVGVNTLYLASPQGSIMINDRTVRKDTPLADYPIKWSAISDKPKYIPADARDIMFGGYSTVTSDPDGTRYYGMIYPAIRTINYSSNPGGDNYEYTFFYFNGTSWTKFTDGSKFLPGF